MSLSLSFSFFWLVYSWNQRKASLLRPGTLFIPRHHLLPLLILPPLMFSSLIIKLVRTFQRTFLDAAFIRNAKSSFPIFWFFWIAKSSLPLTLFLQSFSRVCVRIEFIVFNKWVWVKWFMTSLICSFVCCGFVTDCQRRRLLGHMWIILGTYVNAELANPLTKRTLLVIR